MQYDDISQLPPRYQEQVRRKLGIESRCIGDRPLSAVTATVTAIAAGQEKAKTKYRNRKTKVDGITFDSIKEARRFVVLREMEKCGEIYDLRLQVRFTLVEGFTKPNGERVYPEVYKADFTYYRKDENGQFTIYIVEDVKTRGTRTEKYKIKKKQMFELRHIEIQEV